jgi:hypothetical protein
MFYDVTENGLGDMTHEEYVSADDRGDVVEICPAYDPTQITSLVGVDVMFELMNLMAKG